MKASLLEELKVAAEHLCEVHPSDVQRADVFDAFIIPVATKKSRELLKKGNYDLHIAEFDIVVLGECFYLEASLPTSTKLCPFCSDKSCDAIF